MSEADKSTDVNWDEMDLGTDLGEGEPEREVKDARYLLKIENIEMKTRDKEDDPKRGEKYLNVRFRIMDAQKDEFADAIGESVFQIFNLGEKSIWVLKQLIKAALPTYTGSKIPKDIEGQFVSAFVFTHKYGEYENLKCKQFKLSTGWTGVGYIIDENGKMEMIGKKKGDKPASKSTATGSSSSQPKNGTKPAAAKPAAASKPTDDDEVEV